MDSTAFSLHFQNVVPPDDRSANSAGSLKTPTGDSLPSDSHGFVFSKGFKKHVPRSKISDEKLSGSAGDSSNMSLVVENPDSYDRYGMLSPTLEALLAEANKPMRTNSTPSGREIGASLHDNEVPTLRESLKDRIHDYNNDIATVIDDACFDSNIAEGPSIFVDSDGNGNDIHSPNKGVYLPVDGLTKGNVQVRYSVTLIANFYLG